MEETLFKKFGNKISELKKIEDYNVILLEIDKYLKDKNHGINIMFLISELSRRGRLIQEEIESHVIVD